MLGEQLGLKRIRAERACRCSCGLAGFAPLAKCVFFCGSRGLVFVLRVALVVQQRGELVSEGIRAVCSPLQESKVIEDGGHREHGEQRRLTALVRQIIPLGDVVLQRGPCRQRRALPVRCVGDRVNDIRKVAKRSLDGGVDFPFAKLGVMALQGDELE